MNLVELYQATPVERHRDIRVSDGLVAVKAENGGTSEYTIDGNGELFLISTDADIRADLAAIKERLGI
jgi:hypothetical protein